MVNFDYDCSGWATKANTKCYDGLTIDELMGEYGYEAALSQ